MSKEEFPKKELETLWAPWRVEYFETNRATAIFSKRRRERATMRSTW